MLPFPALVATVMLAAPRGLGHYLRTHFLDTTFKDKYIPNAFDLALLIPYFAVMFVLAAYGLHRYFLVYLYYKHRRNRVTAPPGQFAELPRVTVQLPIYNERYVVERLVEAVCRMEYPRELLEIQVLDDSTDETVEMARAAVERYAALGYPVAYLHREQPRRLQGRRAGGGDEDSAGANSSPSSTPTSSPPGFPAAHHPLLHRSEDRHGADALDLPQPRLLVADAGAKPSCSTATSSSSTARGRAAAASSTSTARPAFGAAQAIEDAGGWQHDTLTEDTDLSYRAQLHGWRFVYLPEIECPAEVPVEMNAFKAQQARWAKGLMQTAKKILPRR